MEANRHGRYHRRQPAEKQINFFPPFLPSIQHDGQLLLKMMCGFIGVDVGCQSNIRGTGNWQWRWWGNPHAYISADKGAVATGLHLSFLPLPPSLSPSLDRSCLPLEIPPLFSHERLLCSLSFMPRLHLPHFLFFNRLAPGSLLFKAPVFSREGRGEAGMPTHSSAGWPWSSSTGADEELIALFIGF